MNGIRESLLGRCLSFFAVIAFLMLQVPTAAFAGSGTKVTHDAIKYFVPEKRIRLDATVVDPKGVTLVRAYFKSKTQADYIFVPMEAQKTDPNTYVATLPAMAKSTEEIEYLFLVVNGANEVAKTEPFTVNAKASGDVPSWQMVNENEPMKLYTEVPNAPSVASSFSDSVSLNVVESGVRFGLVAQLYGASSSAGAAGGAAAGGSGSAGATGAAAGATNAGVVTAATAAVSTTALVAAAVVAAGAAAAGGGGGSSSSSSNSGSNSGGTSNAFAGTWTETLTSVTCSGSTTPVGYSFPFVIPSTGYTIPSTTASILSNSIGATGTVTYSGSLTTSGVLSQTTNLATTVNSGGSNYTVNINSSGTANLQKNSATTGTGSGSFSYTTTVNGVTTPSCTAQINFSMP